MNNRQSGTLRTDHETDRARLDDFPVLESDWQKVLHGLLSVGSDIRYCQDNKNGTLGELFENQVLTVLVEILQEEVPVSADSLKEKLDGWVARLEAYDNQNWKAGNDESPSVETARLIKERLEKSLVPIEGDTDEKAYYRMFHAIGHIQEKTAYYLEQIESSGDMDGALALLLVYVRNYCRIAQDFNGRLSTLPELYRNKVLQVHPAGAVQDSVYVTVTPKEEAAGFTLPAGHPFTAGQNDKGEDLLYQTARAEYISPLRVDEVNAVFLKRENNRVTGLWKQPVGVAGAPFADTLFSEKSSRNPRPGWMVESPMLLLGEGERKVSVAFRITGPGAGLLPPDEQPLRSFSLLLSEEKGWTAPQHANCRTVTSGGNRWLNFEFTLNREGIVPVPCTEEAHGTTTVCPAVRIQASNEPCPYDWASQAGFDAIRIRTEVNGIQNFTFYNELGEVDTTQPFYPFGPQAEKGAWFLFGNREMGHKPLEEVRLKGLWKKLPETETEFDRQYRDYGGISASSFLIDTEWQEDSRWHLCGKRQHLFVPDNGEDRSLQRAELVFDFPDGPLSDAGGDTPEPYEYDRDRDGFFRATLQEPAAGFGTEKYRTLFADTMIHNSRCKEKHRRELPPVPVVPMLADAELSYIACEETTLAKIGHSSILLTRITSLSGNDTYPIGNEGEEPFIAPLPADHTLCFGFLHARGEQTVRMYADLVLPREKIPFYNPQPDKCIKLNWEYRRDNGWKPLPVTSVITDETCGLTQSGFIEIRWPEKIGSSHLDQRGRAWLRASVIGDITSCLAVRGIQTNRILLTAANGDGTPLPAGTIQATAEPDERIATIAQPLPGFGGSHAATERQTAVRQTSRVGNRHRAVTARDYENLVLEHFPDVEKAQCFTVPREGQAAEVCLVVFSRAEDDRYYLSPSWKLAEIQKWLVQYAPPVVSLRVCNPVYEPVSIRCKAVLWPAVEDEGKALRQLTVLAQNYIAPWYRQGTLPGLRQRFSYKELHARLANHEDLMKVAHLEVNGKSLPNTGIETEDLVIKGSHAWNVLLPQIKIELLSPNDGVDGAEIENNFIIG